MNNISIVEEDTTKKIKTKWNDKLEQVAKEIGENAKGYKSMHLSVAQKYSKMYNILTIIGLTLGPLSGVLTSIETLLSLQEPNLYIVVPGIFFSFLSGIIVAIIKFGKYDEQSIANKQAAARYTSVESSVRRQLVLYRNNRMDPTSYLDWLETKYEEVFLSAPLLPASAYKEYFQIAKKLGLSVPNQYATTIVINQEYNQEMLNNIDTIVINKINGNVNDNDNVNGNVNNNVSEINNVDDSNCVQRNGIEIRRGNTMGNLPHLNQYSDKMLEYEMRRFNN